MKKDFALQIDNFIAKGSIRKWVIVGILIGLMAGVGSYILYYGIEFFTTLLSTDISGFTPPSTGNSPAVLNYVISGFHRYLIPVSTVLGGLLSGMLVYWFAPEAEGHGTD
ncbi:MAG: hypothetical protein QW597_03585, partial [Thermoplasmataceae archaeon]